MPAKVLIGPSGIAVTFDFWPQIYSVHLCSQLHWSCKFLRVVYTRQCQPTCSIWSHRWTHTLTAHKRIPDYAPSATRHFGVAAARMCNSLPPVVTSASSYSRLSKYNWKPFFSRTHFLSFSFILIVYRVLEAFSLDATLIFTFNNNNNNNTSRTMVGWRLGDRLAPFVWAANARVKPSLLLYLACVSVLVSAVLRGSLLYVSMWLNVMT